MSMIAGIDLGTTFSAIAVLNSIGKPEIVPNSDGERLTPSAIFFDEESSDIIRVGIEAINSRQIDATRSVRWIKRHMGDVDYKVEIDGKQWTPVELSSLILKKLKQDGSAENDGIKNVVISVPAHFDEVRRKATMDAGKLAGLNVIGIINEPVAAALYYAYTRPVSGKVLVYDLGGGTFDVTIMDVNQSDINIICSQGNHELGGVDFDKKVFDAMLQAYKKDTGKDLINSHEDKAKYEDEAEDIKKTLSRRDSAKKILYGDAGNVRFQFTRDNFQQVISPLLDQADMLIDVALDEANLKAEDIDKVLLVGGSTRIPMVGERLKQKFGFEPEITVNVDECVALGASIQAGLIMTREQPDEVGAGVAGGLKAISLKDVCNHSYGTLCAPIDRETGQRIIANRVILSKNTPLPCQSSQMFYTMEDDQSEIEVVITQGEDSDPEFVNKIAHKKFKLPKNRPAKCPIRVTYSYDLNQRMHCIFEDVQSGKKLELELSLDQFGQIEDGRIDEKTEELAAFSVE